MEELKNRTCEIRAGNQLENSADKGGTITNNNKKPLNNDDNLLNLIAEIVVENMVRRIRHESKQRNEMIKKE
ncbi:hypothetical protein IDJ77_22500 [Mucilaginibacter sp. ZT4R22]|uniref:Uncharacterized protein n=1 Tax=Mucilaginibacter pankratovii TaxID=2772110 RepID=A0ABR7WZC7_9SPHI|nr:hypothetical protein [Mucilaginibacter pankratovii]MBD1366602.1 hypothetical protein [Mucilaginibacter pankratovii]